MDKSYPGTLSQRMRRHISVAIDLLEAYRTGEPFHLYLKKYFSGQRKHGSRDRKIISALCYGYFRMGKAIPRDLPKEAQLITGLFLTDPEWLNAEAELSGDLKKALSLSLTERVESLPFAWDPEKIFPFSNELSLQIDEKKFSLSFLHQPKWFVRIRRGNESRVISRLDPSGIAYEKIDAHSVAFSRRENLDTLFVADKEVVVQDFNSQQTAQLFPREFLHTSHKIAVWDACAASGGKSILAYDTLKNIHLTVSDTRKSILENCRKRFHAAGIRDYNSFEADLSQQKKISFPEKDPLFDLIIADVPCSGSGTWARTPEQLLSFDAAEIQRYASLQKSILETVIPFIRPGGYLLYITCSVFEKENEENVSFAQKKGLKITTSQYFAGYEIQADTLFGALLQKNA